MFYKKRGERINMKNRKLLLLLNGFLLVCVLALVIGIFVKKGNTETEQDLADQDILNQVEKEISIPEHTIMPDDNLPTPTAVLTWEVTPIPTSEASVTQEPTVSPASKRKIKEASAYENLSSEKNSWWFNRQEDHIQAGSGEVFDIDPYQAYYLKDDVTEEDKVIYFSFDCGYELGYTTTILDVLKEKGVKAMFFVTKDFLVSDPELAIRMKEEGHMVGNHTVKHLSLPTISVEKVQQEILECEEYFEEISGYKMDLFIRPPMGEYSEKSLQIAKDLGYTTIFWSIAYNDYDVDNQPGKQYVIDHFKKYYHNGAITLTHTISESNTQALGEVIDYLKSLGFRFGTLDEL